MKKLFILCMAIAMICIGMTSCNGCSAPQPTPVPEPVDSVLIVEKTVAADMDSMNVWYGRDAYVYYESELKLSGYVDIEDTVDIVQIINVFQVGETDTQEATAVQFKHIVNEKPTVRKDEGYWLEDCPMTQPMLKLTYADAFDRYMQADIVKLHSKWCTLRRPLGPNLCMPQYIFGDNKSNGYVFVDAFTGNVSNINPAFNAPIPEDKLLEQYKN